MMSTGSLPSAWLPHHGGRKHDSNHIDTYCNHEDHDRNHPGAHGERRDAARPGCVGYVRLADSWLNTRWRS
ncbi:hypothetical protein BST16_09490 [Mycobacterium asiaticum DSM 44297]|nr:hypothetical protein BST16_09490 [Mycobacterium asiaticum DSM 44297]